MNKKSAKTSECRREWCRLRSLAVGIGIRIAPASDERFTSAFKRCHALSSDDENGSRRADKFIIVRSARQRDVRVWGRAAIRLALHTSAAQRNSVQRPRPRSTPVGQCTVRLRAWAAWAHKGGDHHEPRRDPPRDGARQRSSARPRALLFEHLWRRAIHKALGLASRRASRRAELYARRG